MHKRDNNCCIVNWQTNNLIINCGLTETYIRIRTYKKLINNKAAKKFVKAILIK